MPDFALVLGAGGGIGRAFHAGALAALVATHGLDGRDASMIVGTSAGSIDGAFLRAGVAPHDLLARITGGDVSAAGAAVFERLPPWMDPDEDGPWVGRRPASSVRLRAAMRRPWALAPHSMGTLFAAAVPAGRRPTRLIEQTADALHPRSWPRRPLWVSTVRLDDGVRVVFGRDDTSISVGEAVAASCAIPGFFTPVRIHGERYVDGGAHSPSNADLVAPLCLPLVVVISPMTAEPRARRLSPDSAFRTACRVLLRREIAQIERAGAQVLLIEPSLEDLRVMGAISESMRASKRAAVAKHVFTSVSQRLGSEQVAHVLQSCMAATQPATRSASN